MPSKSHRLLKHLSFLPLCLAITACGGGGGGSNDDGGQQPPSNTAPIAVDDAVTSSNRAGELTIEVLSNDSDSDGDTLTITSVDVSGQGVTPTIENGAILYRIPEGFSGTDEFTYTISDGESEATATVTITLETVLTISGLVGEAVSGPGSVSVLVGGEPYAATLDGSRYTLDLSNPAGDDVVVVSATFPDSEIGKSITLKSYAGLVSELEAAAPDGTVTEGEKATLYLSAASTSVAALLEHSAGEEITSSGLLDQASQLIPQSLVLDGAVAIKSVLAGDNWASFTQPDTYDLLQEYPAAMNIADSLRDTDPTKFDQYRTAILDDLKQAVPVAAYEKQELVFVQSLTFLNRPSGFVLQVSAGTSGNGYLTSWDTTKADNNSISFTRSDREITVDVEGTRPAQPFYDNREACAPDEYGQYSATPVKQVFKRYLDSAVFSAYAMTSIFRCDATSTTFEAPSGFAQVNKREVGDFKAHTQGEFAVDTYLEMDPAIYSGPANWQSVLVQPNADGMVTQRFDFESGYTDSGSMDYLENGRMALNTNRGDYVEYVPLGIDGPALKVLGVVKRGDGSAVSTAGGYLVPFTAGLSLPTPGKIVTADPVFTIKDPDSSYYEGGFGLEFLADNTGGHLMFQDGEYVSSGTTFSWSQADGYLDARYYYDPERGFVSACEEGDTNCVEYRFREVEPLGQHNGDFFVRIYQKMDYGVMRGGEPGTDLYQSSYIDRFSILP